LIVLVTKLGITPSEDRDDSINLDKTILDQVFQGFNVARPKDLWWGAEKRDVPSLAVAFSKVRRQTAACPSGSTLTTLTLPIMKANSALSKTPITPRRVFMKMATEALVREVKTRSDSSALSRILETPSELLRTISHYEIYRLADRESVVGGMAIVAEGKYQNKTVALKFINATIPKEVCRIGLFHSK
jgi:hypothetical protein